MNRKVLGVAHRSITAPPPGTARRGLAFVMMLCAAIAFAFSGGTASAQTTSTVCPSGCTHESIQAAIDNAASGDTIRVFSGTYAGNIQVTKPLTLLGDPGMPGVPGPGPNAPVIDGQGLVADAFDLVDGVSNVTISGFEIRNLAADDWTNGSGVGVQAWVPSTQNITVSHNWFHNVGYGVMAGNDGSSTKYALGTHTGWTVTDNVLEGLYSIGVELTDTSNSSVQNNVIHLGPVRDDYGFGPIGVFSWVHISQSNLTVSGNTIDGTQYAYPAVYIYAYDDVAPTPNLDGVLIQDNMITSTGTPYQVYVRDIGAGTVTGVEIHYNILSELRNRTSATVDATCNWWGSTAGPAPGQIVGQVAGDVVVSPWLGSPGGACGGNCPASYHIVALAIEKLIADVDAINMTKSQGKKLVHELDEVLKEVGQCDQKNACKGMEKFVKEVQKKKYDKHLTAAEEAVLLSQANAIVGMLGCS